MMRPIALFFLFTLLITHVSFDVASASSVESSTEISSEILDNEMDFLDGVIQKRVQKAATSDKGVSGPFVLPPAAPVTKPIISKSAPTVAPALAPQPAAKSTVTNFSTKSSGYEKVSAEKPAAQEIISKPESAVAPVVASRVAFAPPLAEPRAATDSVMPIRSTEKTGTNIPIPNYYNPNEGLAPPPAMHTHRKVPGVLRDPVDDELWRLDEEITKRVRVYGKYRMAAGVGRNRTFSLNDADADLQDRDYHYLFGERLNNTYDPAIYSGATVNTEIEATDKLSFYTQLVFDPWSYTATTPLTRVAAPGGDYFDIRLKYFGANNSTIGEIYRADFRNIAAFAGREAVGGSIPRVTTTGVPDLGLNYDSGRVLDLDYRFQPLRKAWVDYEEEKWHVRAFALADQDQAMTTDDPLGLSNTKDFWQPSPWTAEWVPIRKFADRGTPDVAGSVQRGHYSDLLAFNSKTSYGQYLTALRGVSGEWDLDRAYFGAMIATPMSPWDDYDTINSVPGVFRLKHQVTPQWMVGGLYGFRVGMISDDDREPDAYNQVISFDTKYAMDPNTEVYGQIAGSRDEIDRLSTGNRHSEIGFKSDVEGMAYKAGIQSDFDHTEGHSTFKSDVVWMDTNFRPQLSTYRALRDDNFWGRHISFHEYSPDLEYFRIGTGVDIGRYVGRATLTTKMYNERLVNLYDVRHVRSTDSSSFIENTMRDEIFFKATPRLRLRGLARWQILPKTQSDIEPLLSDFFFIDSYNLPPPSLQNDLIDPGLDPSRFEWAGGFQYDLSDQWMIELSYTRTNDVPDFPRALLNDVFLRAPVQDPEDPNILIDVTQPFVYRQDIFDLPPYDYFSIFKERLIFSPTSGVRWIFHAAQNSYKLWGPIDDMVNHQGLSLDYKINEKVSLFMDYTHSIIGDIPKLIASGFTELDYRDHHNIFANVRWEINKATYMNITYGVFGEQFGSQNGAVRQVNPFSVSEFPLPTIDTEHLLRVSLEGDF